MVVQYYNPDSKQVGICITLFVDFCKYMLILHLMPFSPENKYLMAIHAHWVCARRCKQEADCKLWLVA